MRLQGFPGMMRKQRKTDQQYYLLIRKSRGKSSTGADTGGAPDMPGLTNSKRSRQTVYGRQKEVPMCRRIRSPTVKGRAGITTKYGTYEQRADMY